MRIAPSSIVAQVAFLRGKPSEMVGEVCAMQCQSHNQHQKQPSCSLLLSLPIHRSDCSHTWGNLHDLKPLRSMTPHYKQLGSRNRNLLTPFARGRRGYREVSYLECSGG